MSFEDRKNEKIFYLKLQNNVFADSLEAFYNSRIKLNKIFGNYVFLEDITFPLYQTSYTTNVPDNIFNLIDHQIINDIPKCDNLKIFNYSEKILDFEENVTTIEDILINYKETMNTFNKYRMFSGGFSSINISNTSDDIVLSNLLSNDFLLFPTKDDCKNFWIESFKLLINEVKERFK